MAQQTQIIFEDDIDGSPADGTMTFAYDGKDFEIDLSQQNRDQMKEALAPYVQAARKVGTPAPRRASRAAAPGNGSPSPAEVRAWAKSEGLEVAAKGRIPAELVVRFQAAGQ